jgi:hypothetical protein
MIFYRQSNNKVLTIPNLPIRPGIIKMTSQSVVREPRSKQWTSARMLILLAAATGFGDPRTFFNPRRLQLMAKFLF